MASSTLFFPSIPALKNLEHALGYRAYELASLDSYITYSQRISLGKHAFDYECRRETGCAEKGLDIQINLVDQLFDVDDKDDKSTWRYAVWQTFMRADWDLPLNRKHEQLNQLARNELSAKQFVKSQTTGLWNPLSWLQAIACYFYTKQTCALTTDDEKDKTGRIKLRALGFLYTVTKTLNTSVSLMFALPFFMLSLPLFMAASFCGYGTYRSAFFRALAPFNHLNYYFNRITFLLYDMVTEPLQTIHSIFWLGVCFTLLYFLPSFFTGIATNSPPSLTSSLEYLTLAWNSFYSGITWVSSFLINQGVLAPLNALPGVHVSLSESFCGTYALTSLSIPLGVSTLGAIADIAHENRGLGLKMDAVPAHQKGPSTPGLPHGNVNDQFRGSEYWARQNRKKRRAEKKKREMEPLVFDDTSSSTGSLSVQVSPTLRARTFSLDDSPGGSSSQQLPTTSRTKVPSRPNRT